MAPVNIKYIVSFSSQDPSHKASNIVSGDGTKKWLSDCNDRSGKIEVILQLEESYQLAYIDIGTIWCASLEVRVGRSDWPQTTEFQSLVPTVSLMTPVDCRLSRGSCVTKMFSKADFSSEVAAQKWDRLQIICRQPFRKDVQLGVSFIRLKSANPAAPAELREENMTKQVPGEKTCPDVSSIQQHFFRKILSKTSDRDSPAAQLKQRLLKISGSSDYGSEHEQSLSRTAKLVLKASENSDAQRHSSSTVSTTPKRGLFSDHLAKQKVVPIDQEIKMFFPTLKINLSDIEKLTVADLRHKFERKKRRKLTVEEKRTFSRLCEQFICTLLDEEDETDASFASAVSHQSTPRLENSYNKVSKGFSSCDKNERVTPCRKLQARSLKDSVVASGKAKSCVQSPDSSFRAKVGETGPQYVSTPRFQSKLDIESHTVQKNGRVGTLNSPHSSPIVKVSSSTSVLANSKSDYSNLILSPNTNFSTVSQDMPIRENILAQSNLTNRDPITSSDISSVGDQSENEDCLSSVTYDEEEEQELSDDSDVPSPDSSPNLLKSSKNGHTSHLENIRKSYETFYNTNTPQRQVEDKSESIQNSTSAKKRKFNKESFQQLQGLCTELIDVDEENRRKDCSEDTAASTSFVGNGLKSSNSNGTKSSLIPTMLAVDSLPSTELQHKNVSPRTPKGKVYRMLTSPSVLSPNRQVQRLITEQSCVNKDIQATSSKEITSVKVVNGAVHNNNGVLSKQPADSSTGMSETGTAVSAVFPPQLDFRFSPIGSSRRGGKGHKKVPGQPKISKRGRGRGRPGTVRQSSGNGSRNASGQNSNSSSARPQGEMVFCEKCYGEFSPAMYANHHSFCVRPAVFEEEENNNHVGGAEYHETLIDETVDYSECPLCLERFPQDVLPLHASECGL